MSISHYFIKNKLYLSNKFFFGGGENEMALIGFQLITSISCGACGWNLVAEQIIFLPD